MNCYDYGKGECSSMISMYSEIQSFIVHSLYVKNTDKLKSGELFDTCAKLGISHCLLLRVCRVGGNHFV